VRKDLVDYLLRRTCVALEPRLLGIEKRTFADLEEVSAFLG
jgi:hypothetical protein